MFRALTWPSSGTNNCTHAASGILALISGCTLYRLRVRSQPLIRARIPDALFVQLFPPEDGHVKARNMLRIVIGHTCLYWSVH